MTNRLQRAWEIFSNQLKAESPAPFSATELALLRMAFFAGVSSFMVMGIVRATGFENDEADMNQMWDEVWNELIANGHKLDEIVALSRALRRTPEAKA